MAALDTVRILQLDPEVNLSRHLFRLQKGLILKFSLSPELQPYPGKLFCNHPEKGKAFKRSRYHELTWRKSSSCKCHDGDRFAEIETYVSGSFHFYFQYLDNEKKTKQVSGYFVVDPKLTFPNGDILPLDCIALQTYLAKCLGPLSCWEGRLKVGYKAGYNMIHLTPVQELGGSNSAYSLHDQLKLNSSFNDNGQKYEFDDLKKIIQKLHKKWKLFFICDIVLNHTANGSPWLKDHPESAYNLSNSPHLRPAYVVDQALWRFSCDIACGIYDSRGIPVYINNEQQLGHLHAILSDKILPELNLWEFYGVDVNKVVDEFKVSLMQKMAAMKNSQGSTMIGGSVSPEILVVQDPEYKRLGSSIDIKKAVSWYISNRKTSLRDMEWVEHCCSSLQIILESLNNKIIYDDIADHIRSITHNIVSTVQYERLDSNGPQLGYLTQYHPLVTRYFIDLSKDEYDTSEFNESMMYAPDCKYIVAHPGWIMGGSALDDFAAPGSFAYLRREVIAWGDSVKLRYGKRPEDAPFLWAHMLEYVKLTASIFHGIRLDNCHSTPIHVAEYFIDEARQVCPDLYVIAELFTESEFTDNVFVNRLGVTSLIREAMSAHDSHEQGRLVYRYGGEPVGAFFHLSGKPMVNSVAHALYMDVTHDNPNPTEVRSVYDSFPTAALVNMACCATGSTRGNDEFVPHHVNVVTDNRKYKSWKEDNNNEDITTISYLPDNSGMILARRALNKLHRMLAKDGYKQVYVDQMNYDIVAVTRHCPEDHSTVVLVAHTSFTKPEQHRVPSTVNKHIATYDIKPLHVEGVIDEIILEGRTLFKVGTKEFVKNDDFINGLESHVVYIREHFSVEESQMVRVENVEGGRNVYFDAFPSGSVIAFKVSLFSSVKEAVTNVRDSINGLRSSDPSSRRDSMFKTLTLSDMNRILFRCDSEEKDDGFNGGAYDIPNFGPLVYCGIQGFMSIISSIRTNNDLGHPLCQNLRQGNWLMDYTAQRLMRFQGTKEFAVWLQSVIDNISKLPRFMVPGYFDVFISVVYMRLKEHALEKMSSFIQKGSDLIKSLAMGSIQLVGSTSSAPLPGLSPNLCQINEKANEDLQLLTISAGLPHFSVGLWRSWGRDTFISLRGLLLVTGRYKEARNLILAYGGCVRHGLIPNLLNGGTGARYNCRDATWWWLQAVQDYSRIVVGGSDILKDPVTRMYPCDDSPSLVPGEVEQPLYDVIQEIMQRHFSGIEFRERNAGPDIEKNSRDEAFNVKIGVDRQTGFVFGGNEWNNGTWMDKIGESHTAGNAGVPTTPRDGSAIEIVGLCKSTVRWLADCAKRKVFPYDGVKDDKIKGEKWTYVEWEKKIQNSFEKKFWISEEPNIEMEGSEMGLVHKRGIYKDCYKSSHPFTDYQLRPNFPLAMAVAPEMFVAKNAWMALEMIRKHLCGPLGVGTLDPDDWAYDGIYDNSQDSENYKNARGFNYHQGPVKL